MSKFMILLNLKKLAFCLNVFYSFCMIKNIIDLDVALDFARSVWNEVSTL